MSYKISLMKKKKILKINTNQIDRLFLLRSIISHKLTIIIHKSLRNEVFLIRTQFLRIIVARIIIIIIIIIFFF